MARSHVMLPACHKVLDLLLSYTHVQYASSPTKMRDRMVLEAEEKSANRMCTQEDGRFRGVYILRLGGL